MAKTLLSLLVGAAVGAGALVALNHYGLLVPLATTINGEARPATHAVVTANQPLAGEINKNSYINVADGSRSQVFRFDAQEGQLLDIRSKGPLDARLSVLRDGYLMASTEQMGGFNLCESSGNGSLLKQTRLFYQADRTGSFEIAVSGTGPYAYGPFELEVQSVATTGPTSSTLTPGTPIEAIATGKTQSYGLTIAEPGLYAVALTSCDFDGYLSLTGAGVNLTDDDSGGNYYDPRLLAWLEPGQYTVTASSSGGQPMRGQYSLTAEQQPLPSNAKFQRGGAIQAGQTLLSLLDHNSDSSFSFTLNQPTEVILTARSENVDVYLSLDNDEESWSDDDSGGGPRGTDAQIHEMLPAGQYTVRLGGYGQGLVYLSLETPSR